jgi:hypothetical protein
MELITAVKGFMKQVPREGWTTFSITTFSKMSFSIETLRITAFSITTFSIMPFSIVTLRITAFSIMALSIMPFSIVTLRITAFSIMTISKRTFSIMIINISIRNATVCKMTLSITITFIRIKCYVSLC